MILSFTLIHGLLFALLFTDYLFLIMISFNPRVWGLQDYSKAIKQKVAPKTERERRLALVLSIPFFIIILGGPILSALMLETQLGGEISFVSAFIHLFVLVTLGTLGDLVILDWLIVSKITPQFVIVPGTEAEDYKDFSHHYRGHVGGAIVTLIYCVIIAFAVSIF